MQVFITGSEAFPELERSFLRAKSDIHASFRVFDLRTRLRSPEARAVGETWFDLIVHVLRAGVTIRLTISDFDPIMRSALHRGTWRSLRMLRAAQEVAGPNARLCARAAMHPAQGGLFTRLAFWGGTQRRMARICHRLNALPGHERDAAMRDMPGLPDRITVGAGGAIQPRRWSLPRLHLAAHHQRLAVFDDRRLYIGGMDLDDRHGDAPDHVRSASGTWHDVQVMMEGPVVLEAKTHLDTFIAVTEGRATPAGQRRFLRTLSRRRRAPLWHSGPKTVACELRQAHEALSDRTTHLIYAETQVFRDLRLARHLARRAQANPDLSMILVLPATPEDVAVENRSAFSVRLGEARQARALRILRAAFGTRLFVGGAAQAESAPRRGARDRLNETPLIYIHARVSIFDDDAAIVSSANLSGRSLDWDSEAGVYLNGRRDVGELRRRVMGHWLPHDASAEYFALDTAAEAWAALAQANLRQAPQDRRGFLLPYDLPASLAPKP